MKSKCYSTFVFWTQVIVFALNSALDSKVNKGLQYINDFQYISKRFTISAPFSLVFFWCSFKDGLCWTQCVLFFCSSLQTFAHSQMQRMYWRPPWNFSGTCSHTKPSPESLKLLLLAPTLLCVRAKCMAHTATPLCHSVILTLQGSLSCVVHSMEIHASHEFRFVWGKIPFSA